jgi:formamidopyrimidine-DNA glycosylase
MPELPDVEAYCAALRNAVGGSQFQWIRINHPFLLRSVHTQPDEATGGSVTTVERAGKRIVVRLDNGISLVIHLMIAGRFRWKESPNPSPPDQTRSGPRSPILASFGFSTGVLTLTEAGSKRRASLHVVTDDELPDLIPPGMELLAPDATVGAFAERLRRENHTVKRSLTDARLFSGIGNSYSDEILFAARMSPFTMTGSMDDHDVATLFDATRETLTTWRDRFVAEAGHGFPNKVTAFRAEMHVHGKYGRPCTVCGTPIQRIRYAENECNYCPTCQTAGKVYADRALSRLLKSDWPRTVEELERFSRGPDDRATH